MVVGGGNQSTATADQHMPRGAFKQGAHDAPVAQACLMQTASTLSGHLPLRPSSKTTEAAECNSCQRLCNCLGLCAYGASEHIAVGEELVVAYDARVFRDLFVKGKSERHY